MRATRQKTPNKRCLMQYLAGGVLLSLLVACASKPLPHADKPSFRLQEAYDNASQSGNVDMVASLSTLFDDNQLIDLFESAPQNNFSLQSAKANLVAAGFAVEMAEAALLPSLSIGGNTQRNRSQGPTGKNYQTSYGVSLDSSWELDVWGRNRENVQLAEIETDIAKMRMSDAEQSIAAQIAQTYFQLIYAKRRVKLYEQEYRSYRDTEQTIKERLASGLSTNVGQDLDNAKTATYNAQQRLQTAELDIKKTQQTLNQLRGVYPTESVASGDNYPNIMGPIETGIPSDLLMKRPDVKMAFLQVVKADKSALVSYKDMFPRFNLTASYGRTSDTLAGLTNGSLSVWRLLSNVAQPLFDAGQRKARLQQNVALADAAYANYQQTLLAALTEVEQLLSTRQSIETQLKTAQKALAYAKTAETTANKDYAMGLSSIFDLLNARRARYGAAANVEALQLQRYQNRVALALALGKAV